MEKKKFPASEIFSYALTLGRNKERKKKYIKRKQKKKNFFEFREFYAREG